MALSTSGGEGDPSGEPLLEGAPGGGGCCGRCCCCCCCEDMAVVWEEEESKFELNVLRGVTQQYIATSQAASGCCGAC